MRRKILFVILLTLPALLLLSSCGPSKKLVASRTHVATLQTDSINKVKLLKECNTKVERITEDRDYLSSDLKDLSSTTTLTIADQAKRLKNLQNIIQTQKDVLNNLKTSMANALMNYKSDELNVYIKDGNVYVSLEEKLLFKSGSDVVDPKGKEALKTLAKALNGTKDVNVMIEGHTDNVPIKTKQFQDNWALSTARANSIVRILTEVNGFDSNHISASGRGFYHPIKANDTEVGRANNRRTEVIITPDLQELFKALE